MEAHLGNVARVVGQRVQVRLVDCFAIGQRRVVEELPVAAW
jgi:hypothetical protein